MPERKMKKKLNYIVTFTGEYAFGGRQPIRVKVLARNVNRAIEVASNAVGRDSNKPVDLVVLSVVPDLEEIIPLNYGSNDLDSCPFCGNPDVSLVDTLNEYSEETQYIAACDCCGATQPASDRKSVIRTWNHREAD
jgi:Lar family restriction alleviation protein